MSSNYVDISDMGREAEETELQRAANEKLIKEGRIMKHSELEKRRREEEGGEECTIRTDGSIRMSSSGTSHYSSQRSSVDMTSSISAKNMDTRELRSQLNHLEEKLKGAMMANVQQDNENQLLKYEVELLKDKLDDLTHSYDSLNKTYLENKRELSYQRLQITELKHRLDYASHQVEARDKLLVEHGLVLIGGTSADAAPQLTNEQLERMSNAMPNHNDAILNGGELANTNMKIEQDMKMNGVGEVKPGCLPEMVIISKTTANLLNKLNSTTLDKQILELFDKFSASLAQVEKLESELRTERERQDNTTTSRYDSKQRANGSANDGTKHELQQIRTQAQEYKFKYQESLAKMSSLENDIVRLEGQTKRYKTIADSCEESESNARQDLRKCKCQLRELQTQLDDVLAENTRLHRLVDGTGRSSTSGSYSSYRRKHESSVTK